VDGRFSIVAGLQVDPGQPEAPVDLDTRPVPRMGQEAHAGLCIRHGLSPAELPAPADALVSVPRGPASAPALVLARPAPAWVVPAV
jgi:hypothetical protein